MELPSKKVSHYERDICPSFGKISTERQKYSIAMFAMSPEFNKECWVQRTEDDRKIWFYALLYKQ